MKVFFSSFAFFVLISVSLHSQNYRMLNANSEYFFQVIGNNWPYNDVILGLKCDSTRGSSSDSIYFPYRTLAQVLPSYVACNMDPNYPIWAGLQIDIDTNNIHRWQTYSGDSLVIKSQTPISDTQMIYLFPNGNKIIAVHSSNSFMTFANVTDSVENYTMQIFSSANIPISGYWNGKQIIISKNNGVVQMPPILNFPNDTILFYRVAAKRLKYADLYPWQPGDVLDESDYSFNSFSFYYTSRLINKYILARTMINSDSVVFTIQRTTHIISNGPPTNTLSLDTILFSVGNLNSYIRNEMPRQTIDSLHTYDLFYHAADCGKLRMVDHVMNAVYMDMINQCPYFDNFEPIIRDDIYLEGVAGYYFQDQWMQSSRNFQNCYYLIGTSTCGTPLYVGTQEMTKEGFSIWPNPTTDFLNFDYPENCSGYILEIFDLAGKQIQSITLENSVAVDVRNLANGFYLGKIISADGNNQRTIRFVKN